MAGPEKFPSILRMPSTENTTTNTITHVTGYTTDNEPIVETLTVTADQLADILGSDVLAADLLSAGRLGQHDEWMVAA